MEAQAAKLMPHVGRIGLAGGVPIGANLAPATMADIRRWFAVRTKPRAEGVAAAQLRQRGLEVFAPELELRRVRVRLGQERAFVEALFPGYLFARLDLGRDCFRVKWTPGVRSLVQFGENGPAALPEEAIEMLRMRAGGGERIIAKDPFLQGVRVSVCRGPLAGLLAVVERPMRASGRVQILIDLLQRQTRVELDVALLRLA